MDGAGRYSEEEARFIFRDILRAVDYLHGKGICHRDIKVTEDVMIYIYIYMRIYRNLMIQLIAIDQGKIQHMFFYYFVQILKNIWIFIYVLQLENILLKERKSFPEVSNYLKSYQLAEAF